MPKLQQSEPAGRHLTSVGLSACVLGLVLCPLAYVAIGALGGFAAAFSLLTLPPLLASGTWCSASAVSSGCNVAELLLSKILASRKGFRVWLRPTGSAG